MKNSSSPSTTTNIVPHQCLHTWRILARAPKLSPDSPSEGTNILSEYVAIGVSVGDSVGDGDGAGTGLGVQLSSIRETDSKRREARRFLVPT